MCQSHLCNHEAEDFKNKNRVWILTTGQHHSQFLYLRLSLVRLSFYRRLTHYYVPSIGLIKANSLLHTIYRLIEGTLTISYRLPACRMPFPFHMYRQPVYRRLSLYLVPTTGFSKSYILVYVYRLPAYRNNAHKPLIDRSTVCSLPVIDSTGQ